VGSGQSYLYVNIDFTGINIFPGGINEYKRDVYFTITAPYGEGNWDNTNDFSFQDLSRALQAKRLNIYRCMTVM